MKIFICFILFSLFKPVGFAPSKVSSHLKYQSEWEINPIPKNLNQILSQNFTYLGSGTQSYAFISEDQKYVLKFFKMKHLTPKTWLKYLPLPFLHKARAKMFHRQLRLQETFATFKRAFEQLHEETGLVYLHLNKTDQFKKKIRLKNRHGREWDVDLDSAVFMIQEKAQIFYARIDGLMEEKKIAEAKQAVQDVIDFIGARCQKGFWDRDKGVGNNYGYVGNRVIQIDIGRLLYDETIQNPSIVNNELQRVKEKINLWVREHHPELVIEKGEQP